MWKKFVNEMTKPQVGFVVSPPDPCMLYREYELGVYIVIMYVDTTLVIGHKEVVKELKTSTKDLLKQGKGELSGQVRK